MTQNWLDARLVVNFDVEGVHDTNAVGSTSIIKDGDLYKMWYYGYDGVNYASIMYADSYDGMAWSNNQRVIAAGDEGLGATTIYEPHVIKDGSIYKMWYSGLWGGHGNIIYCESENGTTWSGYQLSIPYNSEGTYDTVHAYHPGVIKDGATYKMWYGGHDGTNTRIIYCTSADGLSWSNYQLSIDINTEGTYDTLTVKTPHVVKTGAKYKMWYGGYDGYENRILTAVSDNGTTWSGNTLSLDYGLNGVYDTENINYPTVLNDDGVLRMWYTGYEGNGDRILHTRLGWANHQLSMQTGAEGTYDLDYIYEPFILKESNIYRMWYSGYNISDSTARIIYCTSSDLINWEDFQMVVNSGTEGTYDTSMVWGSTVINDNGTYKLWYTGYDGTNSRILYCDSTDRINWSNHQMVVDINEVSTYDSKNAQHCSVIKDGLTYKMWYTGNDNVNSRILYCTSTDGKNWSDYQLVIDFGSEGTYDTVYAYFPTVIKDNNVYKLWYGGNSGGNPKGKIIYCDSSDGINWSNFEMVIDNFQEATYDIGDVNAPTVLKDDNVYKMVYWAGGDSTEFMYTNLTKYKIAGSQSDDARVLVIRESDWSMETNTTSSGYSSYELLYTDPDVRTVVGRKNDGEIISYGNIAPTH